MTTAEIDTYWSVVRGTPRRAGPEQQFVIRRTGPLVEGKLTAINTSQWQGASTAPIRNLASHARPRT